jgi:hypothetical protein
MKLNELMTIVLAGNEEDATILGGVGQRTKFLMPCGG